MARGPLTTLLSVRVLEDELKLSPRPGDAALDADEETVFRMRASASRPVRPCATRAAGRAFGCTRQPPAAARLCRDRSASDRIGGELPA